MRYFQSPHALGLVNTPKPVQVALSRWAQQDDVVIGTATNGRNRPELQGIVGDMVNMVALRTKLQPEQTFLQVLASVRTTQLNALKNGDLPFTKLVETLGVTRSPAYNPVFQAMLALNEGTSTPGSSSVGSNLDFQHISAEVSLPCPTVLWIQHQNQMQELMRHVVY